MILFAEDWGKYPDAIIDTKTGNKSFLEMAGKLAAMGIRNNAFFLSLLNPKLQGVDPRDPNLTTEMKLAIQEECQRNPWYSIREVIHLPSMAGPDTIPFYADRSLIALVWCFYNHIDIGIIKPRQTGKSVGMDGLGTQLLALENFSSRMQLLTKDAKLRRINVRRLRRMVEILPSYLMPLTGDDADNNETVTVKGRDNTYETAVGQGNPERADLVGRGLTSEILFGDEIPYIPNVHVSMPVAFTSGTAARNIAREANSNYGNVFCTTAGRRDTDEGKWAYDLFHGGYTWNEILFDCQNVEEAKEVIRNNSRAKDEISAPIFVNATFNHRQLGKSDEWLLEALGNSRLSGEAANRDFFNQWPSGGEGAAISTTVLRRITAHEMDPLHIEHSKRHYETRWYYPKHEIESRMDKDIHLITLDSANAIGRDSNGMTIINSRTGELAGMSDINEANLMYYAMWVFETLMRFPNAVFVVENKSSAQAIIDILIVNLHRNGEDPFRRIYNQICSNPDVHMDKYREIQASNVKFRSEIFYNRYRSSFGFQTTGSSRAVLFDVMLNFVTDKFSAVLRDKKLTEQLKGLRMKKGRVDHTATGHDDLVISWLMGMYFLMQTRNLSWYGLQSHLVLSMVQEDTEDMNREERGKATKRQELREEIELLKEQMKEEKIPTRIAVLRSKLARLARETASDGGEAISFGALMDEINDHRTKKR